MATPALTVPAPAKLNLFLHVTGRRADGYHTLESVFVALDFGDTITIETREDGVIAREGGLADVSENDDIAVRAARSLQRETRCPLGARIAIDKRIPAGGGLGGGSSDAASVLLALNRLWKLRLPRDALMRLGLALGADVPFFLFGQPAFVRGIGEELSAVTLPPRWVCVIAPPVAVPTATIFAAPELTRATPSVKISVFSESYGRNDLQAPACARHPDIAGALAELARHSPSARMSGSGGCVFACFGSEAEAVAACRAAVSALTGARGFVARTLARHPLASLA